MKIGDRNFSEESISSEFIARELCAGIGIRKRVPWLEWLISEIYRELKYDIKALRGCVFSRGETDVDIAFTLELTIYRNNASPKLYFYIHHDKRFYIRETGEDYSRIVCKERIHRLYMSDLIFPKLYVKEECLGR